MVLKAARPRLRLARWGRVVAVHVLWNEEWGPAREAGLLRNTNRFESEDPVGSANQIVPGYNPIFNLVHFIPSVLSFATA